MEYVANKYDIFYISYDEPNCEENWARVLEVFPSAGRVHGVKGFDTAHKTVGQRANTDRVITIDGDNWIYESFKWVQLDITDEQAEHIFSWTGLNTINGLAYGNGGIKLWPTKTIQNLNSHENATSERGRVDFCWDWIWNQQDTVYSETRVNATPFQAFRAGFREGVKMTLNRGAKQERETLNKLNNNNLRRLATWCSVGADVPNGTWAMLGTRLGTYKTNLTDWDHNLIADYDWFDEYWKEVYKTYKSDKKRWKKIQELGEELYEGLHFTVADFDERQSRFWKENFVNPSRGGIIHPGQM